MNEIPRRQFLQLGAAAMVAAAGSGSAHAVGYPTQPVRIICGFPAGGLSDILARLLSQPLSDRLGQQVIVENRPGAATNIATEAVVHAAPDGHTLLLATAMNSINATVYDKLNFTFMRDMTAVAGIADAAFVLELHPSIPARTVPEFIAYAKANQGKLGMASGGVGSPEHVAGELFKMLAGVDMLHVPYRGSAPALVDMLAGQVQVYFGPIAPSIEHIRAGKLRALAVTTAKRSEALPDLPTLGEFLPGFAMSAWQGLAAPRGTPKDVVERLNRDVNAILADPRLKTRLVELGTTPLTGSPDAFGSLIAADTEKWAKVVKTAGIRVD
jgi:tripartite-type tricarboxylate transporter receptor subunit TctC